MDLRATSYAVRHTPKFSASPARVKFAGQPPAPEHTDTFASGSTQGTSKTSNSILSTVLSRLLPGKKPSTTQTQGQQLTEWVVSGLSSPPGQSTKPEPLTEEQEAAAEKKAKTHIKAQLKDAIRQLPKEQRTTAAAAVKRTVTPLFEQMRLQKAALEAERALAKGLFSEDSESDSDLNFLDSSFEDGEDGNEDLGAFYLNPANLPSRPEISTVQNRQEAPPELGEAGVDSGDDTESIHPQEASVVRSTRTYTKGKLIRRTTGTTPQEDPTPQADSTPQ